MKQKQIEGTKSLVILLILALIALYSAYNYQKHIQELKVMQEEVKQIQTQQELLIKLMEKEYGEENIKEIEEEINKKKTRKIF